MHLLVSNRLQILAIHLMEMRYRILMANHEILQQSAVKKTLKMKIQVHFLSIVIKKNVCQGFT